jgi:catechol 2,3-dioxygenase-like lactoylglutathione lyase family enzyme
MQLGTYPIGHLALRVTDLDRAKRFYVDTLGFGLLRQTPGALFLRAHGTLIALLGPSDQAVAGDRFNPFRVGLDHIALAVADVSTLQALLPQLDAAGVPHHGIEPDPVSGATYISVYDPDGIAWELYVLPPR